MTEDRLTFLTSVELPTYCFVSEAVEWMAVGRVPQAHWIEEAKTYQQVEYRFYWREMPDNFEPSSAYAWFDRFEFESLGIPVDENYFPAAERCAGEYVWDLPRLISDYESKEPAIVEGDDGSTFDIWKHLAVEKRALLSELRPLQILVDQVEAQFRSHYEIAWAKLFQLLALGEIECFGIDLKRWEKLTDDGQYESAAEFEVIRPTCISLTFNWKENKLKSSKRKFVALRVRTSDVIKHRRFLLQEGKPVTLERFGSFYMTKSSGSSPLRRRRGRPHEVDWQELKKHFAQMVQEGTLPSSKESCLYELIAFAERSFGKSPSRSSVQRNLSNELGTAYAQK